MPGILMSRIDEVGTELADQLDRLVAAAGLADHLVALLLEDLLEVEADDRLVLGDDDTRGWRVSAAIGVGGDRRADSSAAMRSSSASCSRLELARSGAAQRVAVAGQGVGVAAGVAGLGVGEGRLRDQRPQPGVFGLLLEERAAAPR